MSRTSAAEKILRDVFCGVPQSPQKAYKQNRQGFFHIEWGLLSRYRPVRHYLEFYGSYTIISGASPLKNSCFQVPLDSIASHGGCRTGDYLVKVLKESRYITSCFLSFFILVANELTHFCSIVHKSISKTPTFLHMIQSYICIKGSQNYFCSTNGKMLYQIVLYIYIYTFLC